MIQSYRSMVHTAATISTNLCRQPWW